MKLVTLSNVLLKLWSGTAWVFWRTKSLPAAVFRQGVLFLSLLLFLGLAEASDQPHLRKDLLDAARQELDLGKVVVVYRMSNEELDSEQYADWSAYLNEFALSRSKRFVFHPADKEFDALLEKNDITVEDDYTVFMKRGGVTYYYDGVILEPMVYVSVEKSYSGQVVTDMDKAFLPTPIELLIGW